MRIYRHLFVSSAILRAAGIVMVSAPVQASVTLTTIHEFTGAPDGAGPNGSLALGAAGIFYGTTAAGGASSCGSVFSLAPPSSPGGAWTETVLYSFPCGIDGGPTAGVTIDSNGTLYGVTFGQTNGGSIFSLTPPTSASGAWMLNVLYTFSSFGIPGSNPSSPPVIGTGGVLYGTTVYGGMYNNGTVYSLTPPSSPGGLWTEAVLYSFAGAPSDGGQPQPGLVINGGALFGTTNDGGTGPNSGYGTVFQLTPPPSGGGTWSEAILLEFDGTDGNSPIGTLAIGAGGVLYGATIGGSYSGTVYSLSPPASPGGAWTQTVLHNFVRTSDGEGANPNAGVIIGQNRTLYGTTGLTEAGRRPSGDGTVFSLKPPGSAGGSWTEHVLHRFQGADGENPLGLAIGADGAFYGVTYQGGTLGDGTIFRLAL